MSAFGPGSVIPYHGDSPRYREELARPAEEWHCEVCDTIVPAGVMPFPHQGCPPGTVVTVRPSVALDPWLWRRIGVKTALDEFGTLCASVGWWPTPPKWDAQMGTWVGPERSL